MQAATDTNAAGDAEHPPAPPPRCVRHSTSCRLWELVQFGIRGAYSPYGYNGGYGVIMTCIRQWLPRIWRRVRCSDGRGFMFGGAL